ncbi:uncharacterized protein AMSG_08569 [Thecamonas trahens ATCC 50062]|uniref:Uncharacterized protein n=1 Tax=Thecamonas trahens ATCC 50062 TaxID=461836 RepID=A0A0L0DMQ7_THETB|nr:hypothetical protein AMSG_08569 [Thecamonas trahens ATCC 50062]KNC52693.1 hypothetical protein AMSG_08569 [Thecamonas trahens ATCC 50062]|eukprot:XP_013755237.1 hypothetical protein AMSG_08569 [Thecamonas trahens ATCC 50062]
MGVSLSRSTEDFVDTRSGKQTMTRSIPFAVRLPNSLPPSMKWASFGESRRAKISYAIVATPTAESVLDFLRTPKFEAPLIVWPSLQARVQHIEQARPIKEVAQKTFFFHHDTDEMTVEIDSNVVPRGGVVSGKLRFERFGDETKTPSEMDVTKFVVHVEHRYRARGSTQATFVLGGTTVNADSINETHDHKVADSAKAADAGYWSPRATAGKTRRRRSAAELRALEAEREAAVAAAAASRRAMKQRSVIEVPFSFGIDKPVGKYAGVDASTDPITICSSISVKAVYSSISRMSLSTTIPIRVISQLCHDDFNR